MFDLMIGTEAVRRRTERSFAPTRRAPRRTFAPARATAAAALRTLADKIEPVGPPVAQRGHA